MLHIKWAALPLVALVTAGGAGAVTPLTVTVTANPATAATTTLSATRSGAGTSTVNGSVSAGNVNVAQFNTATGILVGASVAVNTAVSATAQVTGTVNPNGGGRTVESTTNLNGTVAIGGASFSSGNLSASRSCSGGNCPNSPSNQSSVTPGAISGTATIAAANLGAFAGNGNVAFTRTATGSSQVLVGSGALTGQSIGFFNFGGNTAGSYGVTYSYVNFATPSFSGNSVAKALTLDFGNVLQNSAPLAQNFSLFNIGNVNTSGLSLMSVTRLDNNGLFGSTLAPFANGLDAGASRAFQASLNPTGVGNQIERFRLVLRDAAEGLGQQEHQLDLTLVANIIQILDPVPEPQSWMTMLLGFGAVGLVARRRRVPSVTA